MAKKKQNGLQVGDQVNLTCDQCGKPMIVCKNKKGGLFAGCSGYPECSNAKPLPTNGEPPDSQPAVESNIFESKSSVLIKKTARGDTVFDVKVYDENPTTAAAKAVKLYSRLSKHYYGDERRIS